MKKWIQFRRNTKGPFQKDQEVTVTHLKITNAGYELDSITAFYLCVWCFHIRFSKRIKENRNKNENRCQEFFVFHINWDC